MDAELVLVGLDDTDRPGEGGTGRLARELATALEGVTRGTLVGVTRHRLLQDSRVPCTRKNQASCVGIRIPRASIAEVRDWVSDQVRLRALPGSDPGVCVGGHGHITSAVTAFGERAKRRLLGRQEAMELADAAGVSLTALGGTGDGMIGALAAVGLRASGDDGRFTLLGRIRDLTGMLPVSALRAAGIALVCDAAGTPLPDDALVETADKVRPWLRNGEPRLVVARERAGAWRPIRGEGER